uniref:Ice-binding protein C-terminal domain-containing protein n=1 Tax=viral metagenome TaxID=1070528 RepID=A0A6M3LQS4_9ZZZZ
MKTILTLFIACVLWLMSLPAHPYTWEPPLHMEWELAPPRGVWTVYIESDHFKMPLKRDLPVIERVTAYERFIHAAAPGPVTAAPEPATIVLLASGLVGLWGVRRRK